MGRRYYLIDHRVLFLFGFLFYLVTPYIAGKTRVFEGFPGMALYRSYFTAIPGQQLIAYALITIAWLPAFLLGHFCFKLIKPSRKSLQLFPATATSKGVSYIAYLLAILLVLFTISARNSLFGGYGSYDIAARGKLSTLLVICNFFLAYQLLGKQKISWLLAGCTGITAVLLLSMGGRLYVFQTFIILLIYKTSFAPKRWNFLQLAAVALPGFLVGTVSGIWRMGASYDFERAGYSFLAEPIFTWFSTSTFLISNQIPLFNMPWNFLTSFLNLIPNTVFSLKQFVISAQAMGYSFQSPLGADSVWTTYVINFGALGSCIFIFLTSFLLSFLRSLSETHRFWAVYYILICAMLPFQFFRDGFYIINKQLFFNFLLFPAALLAFFRTILFLQTFIADPGKIKKNQSPVAEIANGGI